MVGKAGRHSCKDSISRISYRGKFQTRAVSYQGGWVCALVAELSLPRDFLALAGWFLSECAATMRIVNQSVHRDENCKSCVCSLCDHANPPGAGGTLPSARCRAGIQVLAGLAIVTTFTCVITISANYLGAIARRLAPGSFVG